MKTSEILLSTYYTDIKRYKYEIVKKDCCCKSLLNIFIRMILLFVHDSLHAQFPETNTFPIYWLFSEEHPDTSVIL